MVDESTIGLANNGLSAPLHGIHARYLEATFASSGKSTKKEKKVMPYKYVEAEDRKNALKINGSFKESDPVLQYLLTNVKQYYEPK